MKKEEILDKAIRLMKENSLHKSHVSNGENTEFDSHLSLAKMLYELPKKQIPQPAMQRKFITAEIKVKSHIFFFHFSRLFQGGIAAVVFILLGTTVYATANSLPGEKLFTVKRAAEHAQLALTTDPVKKAALQVNFTQRRLAEAQEIFTGPYKNPNLEAAALQELADQTKTTIEDVKTVAVSNDIKNSKHPLVATLQEVNKQQQELLNNAKTQSDVKSVAINTLAQTKDNDSKIKEIVSIVAASNEETKATLSVKPADKTATTTTETGLVKGDKTDEPSTSGKTASSTQAALSQKKVDYKKSEKPSDTEASSTPDNANTATGAFIIEDPTPGAGR